MMTTKTHNYECCMCGDHGLSYELFRCKVCHFRSQHRYCSNLYPKAESYRVCNWCLIQKNNNDHQQDTLTPTTTTTSNSPSSQDHHHQLAKTPNKRFINNHVGGPRTGIGAKSLQPTSPIKKPAGGETRSPSARKRIVNGRGGTGQNDNEKIRRTKSEELSNNTNNSSSSSRSSGGYGNGGGGGGGGPAVIKHVFRNKVRRYKLLEEVSS